MKKIPKQEGKKIDLFLKQCDICQMYIATEINSRDRYCPSCGYNHLESIHQNFTVYIDN